MIILRCVICDSERTCYGRSALNATNSMVCADCGGCSWEVLMMDGPALALSTAEIRRTTRDTRYTFAYGSMGEYVDE